VGAAIALNLLFGVPLFTAGLMTAVVAFAILALQTRGYRRFELAIAAVLGLVLLGFLYDFLQVGVDLGAFGAGLVPSFSGTESVLLAVGILGATVMPHVSTSTPRSPRTGSPARDEAEKRELLRSGRLDVMIAMGVQGSPTSPCSWSPRASSTHRADRGGLDRGGARRLRDPARRRRGPRLCHRPTVLGLLELERRHLLRTGRHVLIIALNGFLLYGTFFG